MYLLIWVDDFIYTSDREDLMKWFKSEASQRFSMKHLGDLTWCLKLKVDYTPGKSMTITQKAHIEELGEVFRVMEGFGYHLTTKGKGWNISGVRLWFCKPSF